MILSENLNKPLPVFDSSTLKNPFVGLRAFEEDEDYLFFGRDAEINDLLKKFSSSRFLAVIGSSGSGKSSLVKSGLLPSIYSGFLSVGRNWRVAVFRPGNDPIGNMAHELAGEGVLYESVRDSEIPYEPIIEATLRRSGGGLVQAYRQAHLLPTENLLIVIDQFEELFRFSRYEKEINEGRSDSLSFINLLLTAAQQNDFLVYVLLTMRSDFLGDCAQFRGLPEAINAGQYLVPRMTRDEIREAITGPIAVGGAKIAPRLLTRLLNDVGDDLDQLPILQHAMMRTWNSWQKKKRPDLPIDIADYEETGGMSRALSLHADEAYAELKSDKQRLICELMFKALTDKAADVRGIRRPKSVEDLCALTNAGENEVIEVVEVFRKPGRTFLMPPPNIALNRSSIIDISHESLMRVWEKLTHWTEEEVVSSTIYKRMADASEREARGEGSLWVNPELQIALNWRKRFNVSDDVLRVWAKPFNTNFDQAIDFLKRSNDHAIEVQKKLDEEAKRKKRRNQRLLIGGIVLLIVFAVLALTSYIFFSIAQDREAQARDNEAKAKKSEQTALNEKMKAEAAQSEAERQKTEADNQKHLALLARDSARTSDSLAKIAEAAAISSANQEKQARLKADTLLNRVAAAEYQRLIREGPIDEESIYADTFDFKLIAYDYHLGRLGVTPKNDELYEKLYYCLKFGPNAKAAIAEISDSHHIGLSDTISLDDGTLLYAKEKSLYVNSGTGGSERQRDTFKYDVSTLAFDNISKRIFVATNGYDLSILKYSSTSDTIENIIPLGGRITAIDYHNNPDIIFFGLATGEVGYIKYTDKKESRYQPVYRNDLGGEVTALDFFEKNGRHYLMAASSKGKVVVFESGLAGSTLEQFLNPNYKLAEIALPDNYGDVKKAKYDPEKDRIIFSTSKRTYSWNPFVEQLLPKLEKGLDKKRANLQTVKSGTRYYTESVNVAPKYQQSK